MHCLLVEDEHLVGAGIMAGLESANWTVDWVQTAGAAKAASETLETDIIILDLNLPDQDGRELLRYWRKTGLQAPILILSARDRVSDRVAGLQDGADDYLLKPFDLDELLARLQALSRRYGGHAQPYLQHGSILLYPAAREVTLAGQPVHLSRRELALLEKLLVAGQRILTEEQLKDSLYGFTESPDSNALNVHIYNLRKKLGAHVIKTVRGVGYRLGPASGASEP